MTATATRTAGHTPAIRAAQIDLFGADGALMSSACIVVADEFPEIVTWDVHYFVRDFSIGPGAYRLVRPYHLSAGA